jgi:hypothetical protein
LNPATVSMTRVIRVDFPGSSSVSSTHRTVSNSVALSALSTCADWFAASFKTRGAFATKVRPVVQLNEPIPSNPKLAEAAMYGFISGECERAEAAGLNPASVGMDRVLHADFPGSGG